MRSGDLLLQGGLGGGGRLHVHCVGVSTGASCEVRYIFCDSLFHFCSRVLREFCHQIVILCDSSFVTGWSTLKWGLFIT